MKCLLCADVNKYTYVGTNNGLSALRRQLDNGGASYEYSEFEL